MIVWVVKGRYLNINTIRESTSYAIVHAKRPIGISMKTTRGINLDFLAMVEGISKVRHGNDQGMLSDDWMFVSTYYVDAS